MVNYESDEAIQNIQDEMYAEQQQKPRTTLQKMQPRSRIWIGVFVGAIVMLYLWEKITMQQGVLFLAIGAFILFMMRDQVTERGELTYIECMVRLNDTLKFLQKHPIGDNHQIPKGEVHITPVGRKQWYEGQPFKRSYGVKIYEEETDVWEWFFVELDVFSGDIITFKHSPEGVYGDETKDIKLMPTYDMLTAKKRDQYLQRAYKGPG